MNTEKVAFDIISLAGDAKAELQKALKLAHEGKFAETQSLIDKASEQLQQAHKLQTQELLTREANGEKLSFNVLISHAQDYLMTTYTLKDVAVEIINLYQILKNNTFILSQFNVCHKELSALTAVVPSATALFSNCRFANYTLNLYIYNTIRRKILWNSHCPKSI